MVYVVADAVCNDFCIGAVEFIRVVDAIQTFIAPATD